MLSVLDVVDAPPAVPDVVTPPVAPLSDGCCRLSVDDGLGGAPPPPPPLC